ncbi:MAG: hypothetical protein ACLFWG_00570 [Longimicrobiales bacterium]
MIRGRMHDKYSPRTPGPDGERGATVSTSVGGEHLSDQRILRRGRSG